jgi:hypothetical protein
MIDYLNCRHTTRLLSDRLERSLSAEARERIRFALEEATKEE